jgi:diguanylate cyclase (GGDEF)-like protein/PAS domain S-box-containing protein
MSAEQYSARQISPMEISGGHQARIDMANIEQAEDALRESEIRYRRLFETAKDGILLLDAVSGQITDVNPFLMELLGYTHKELLGKRLWEIGSFKDAVASQTSFRELQQKKYIRYEELPLETKDGKRVEVEFVSNLYQVNSKQVIQCNIRDISERTRTKDRLRNAYEELSALVDKLQKQDREMKLVNRMNDMLQACKTQTEAYQVIALAVCEMFTGQSGGLAILHDSGKFLETMARWGDDGLLESIFSLDDCWAMRRGQPYEVADPQTNVICHHFVRSPRTGYLCLPLVVQGEMLGLFYLATPVGMNLEHAISWKQLVITVGEGIKLSLSNLKLRELMREQATHDPLTGLFNRRYLNDTLPRELNHARRLNTPTSIAMLDIDHFKSFNDTFGHEAGDLLLREMGRVLHENIRQSDIACRFGGEEFVLVLLDSPLEAARNRIEKICTLVKEMQIRYGDQLLGTVSLSAGLVGTPEQDMNVDQLLRAADEALYAAKRAGRDCTVAYGDLWTEKEKISARPGEAINAYVERDGRGAVQ